MKVKELLSDESKWCKRGIAKNSAGSLVDENSEKACQWCLVGAVLKCYQDKKERLKIFIKINKEVNSKNLYYYISNWSGHPDRTFQDVKKLVEKLDI